MNINGKVCDHVRSVLRTYDIEPKPLDRMIDGYFRHHRELNSQMRRAIADTAFNVIRWRLRIEGELCKQGQKKPGREQIIDYFLNNAPFEVNDAPPKDSPDVVAAYYSLPEWLVKRLMKQYGKEIAYRLMVALKDEAPVTLRTNTLKTLRDDLLITLENAGYDVRPTEYSPYGIAMNARAALGANESYKRGLFDIQDEASQLASMAVGARPSETILDACAGAGGKSLMLAMMMGDRGTIIASDVDPRKLNELNKRARRAGVESITSLALDNLGQAKKYKGKCDAVLLDVPCSGTGTLRRSPDLALRLSESDVAPYAEKQGELLREYSTWLKGNGRLIYSTCSILAEENENVVEDFMNESGFSPLGKRRMNDLGIDERLITPEGYFKSLPSESSMDGFFACVMTKAESQ